MTDFEERAREIIKSIGYGEWEVSPTAVSLNGLTTEGPTQDYVDLTELIITALRAAHNEALEKAAKVAGETRPKSKGAKTLANPARPHGREANARSAAARQAILDTSEKIAAAIRALKEE